MAAVTMHNLCVCRARQVLSSWLTRALPSFSSKTLPSALAPHSCGMLTGSLHHKRTHTLSGVCSFVVEARRIELLSENESKRLSSSVVTNLSYRLRLLPVTESALHYSVNFPGGDTDLSPWVANYLTLFQPRRRQAGRTATYLLSSD